MALDKNQVLAILRAHEAEKIYAVIRCLEIISGASRRPPEEICRRHSGIAWSDIAAAGNVYRHDYEAIEENEIWNTVQIDLPPLLAVVIDELQRLSMDRP